MTTLADPYQAIADLPIDVLKRILAFVNDIEQLDVRACVGLVSRSFASAVRQMPSVMMSSQNFTGTKLGFSVAAKECLSATLAYVTQLELRKVQSSNCSRMFSVIRCCPVLNKLQMHLESEQLSLLWTALVQHVWQPLNRDSNFLNHLQGLEITSTNGVGLQAESTTDVLRRQEGLASISAGDLAILRGLTRGQSTRHPSNEEIDSAMIRLMPALLTIDIGANPLHVPFHGTALPWTF